MLPARIALALFNAKRTHFHGGLSNHACKYRESIRKRRVINPSLPWAQHAAADAAEYWCSFKTFPIYLVGKMHKRHLCALTGSQKEVCFQKRGMGEWHQLSTKSGFGMSRVQQLSFEFVSSSQSGLFSFNIRKNTQNVTEFEFVPLSLRNWNYQPDKLKMYTYTHIIMPIFVETKP